MPIRGIPITKGEQCLSAGFLLLKGGTRLGGIREWGLTKGSPGRSTAMPPLRAAPPVREYREDVTWSRC